MSTLSGHPRRRHAASPFQPDPEPVIEVFAVGDRVSHDSHGLGRVVSVYASGATVDFGSSTIRVATPFSRMTKL